MMGKITTIIFDVDGTLSEAVSWLRLTEGLGADANTHQRIFEDFKGGKINYPEAKKKLINLWQSSGNANRDFMKKMFESWKLKKGVKNVIDYLKDSYRLCLISGAVDLYVDVVAKKLNIADWYANTDLSWDNNGNLIDFNYYVDQAKKKLEQFKEYARKHRLSKDECAVVGDGDSDIALFRELKYGIAVNKESDPVLEKLAFKKTTKITDLKKLF